MDRMENFRGGGPFMLWDSKDLVAKSLRKLGYLDDSWNTDFTEALTCFWNAAAKQGATAETWMRMRQHLGRLQSWEQPSYQIPVLDAGNQVVNPHLLFWRYFGLRTFCQVIRRLRRCMTSGLQWRPTLKFIHMDLQMAQVFRVNS